MNQQPKWLLGATSAVILVVALLAAVINHPPGDTPIARSAALPATGAAASSTTTPAAPTAAATATSTGSSAPALASVGGAGGPAATPGPTGTPPATPAPATPMPTPAPAYPRFSCQPPPANQYATCLFTESPGTTMTFYLWVPANYDPHQQYPLVLLLEGGGERANATDSPATNRQRLLTDPYAEVWGPGYPGPYDPGVQQHWPSFIVIPQVLAPAYYMTVSANTGSYQLPAQPTPSLRMAKEIVDAVRHAYTGVDSSRLYVTGLSMGAYGTWAMIEYWPNEFAAAAPCSGAGDPSLASRLVNLPIWAFHSADDPIVPVSGSRDMIAAIRAAGGHPLYTEYTNAGHGSWVLAYSISGNPPVTPNFYPWLFAQHKATPTP